MIVSRFSVFKKKEEVMYALRNAAVGKKEPHKRLFIRYAIRVLLCNLNEIHPVTIESFIASLKQPVHWRMHAYFTVRSSCFQIVFIRLVFFSAIWKVSHLISRHQTKSHERKWQTKLENYFECTKDHKVSLYHHTTLLSITRSFLPFRFVSRL